MVAPLASSYGQHFGIRLCTTTLPPHRDTFETHWRVEARFQPIFSMLTSKACSTPSSVSRIGRMNMLHGRRKHERVLDVSARWMVSAHWGLRAEYHTFTMYLAFHHVFLIRLRLFCWVSCWVFFAINPKVHGVHVVRECVQCSSVVFVVRRNR